MRRGAAGIAAGLALTALVSAGYALLAPRSREPPAQLVSLEIGADRLTIPAAFVRADAPPSGATSAVEFAAFYPGFSPAGRVDDISARTDVDERFQRLIFISVKPRDGGLDPSERTARLYERFLEETSWSHPGGLIARAFEAGSPFEGDELFYVAPEGRQFAARCRRPDPARKTPNTCVSAFRVDGLDVEVRFSAGLLSEWEKLIRGARGLIESARR